MEVSKGDKNTFRGIAMMEHACRQDEDTWTGSATSK